LLSFILLQMYKQQETKITLEKFSFPLSLFCLFLLLLQSSSGRSPLLWQCRLHVQLGHWNRVGNLCFWSDYGQVWYVDKRNTWCFRTGTSRCCSHRLWSSEFCIGCRCESTLWQQSLRQEFFFDPKWFSLPECKKQSGSGLWHDRAGNWRVYNFDRRIGYLDLWVFQAERTQNGHTSMPATPSDPTNLLLSRYMHLPRIRSVFNFIF
jgi:hypothetical protein